MRRLATVLFVGCAVLARGDSVTVPAPGPRSNPDDQVRFFWYMNERFYPQCVAAGFNTFITFFSSTWYFTDPALRDQQTAERLRFLARMEEDGVDCIDQVKIAAMGGRSKEIRKPFCQVNRDGSLNLGSLDYNNPATKLKVREMATFIADNLKDSPAIVGVQPSSEIRDRSVPSWTKEYDDACRRALGFSMLSNVVKRAPHYSCIPGFPVSRIVPADNQYLRYCLWFWKHGDGWNQYQDDVAGIFNERFGRPIYSLYDPITRTPPVWGSGGHVSIGNQWIYCNPQPCAPSFVVAEEQAMARGMEGMQVMAMLQGIAYRNRIAPKDKAPSPKPAWSIDRPNARYITMPADLLREGFWTLASRRIDGIGLYGWNSIFDSTLTGEKKDSTGYHYTDPTAFPVVSNFFADVATPLGPLLRAVPERAPEVAILESYAHGFFAGRTSFGWGYRWGELATLSNLQPYALWEEEIARDGIPQTVKVLLMPDCEVLTEKTFAAVKEFQARGGVVVSDERLVPGLMPDFLLPDCILSQHNRSASAVKDTAAMRKGAQELRERLEWAYRPYGDTDNRDIFCHVRTWKDGDYVFAINDRRGYGDYVGPWRRIQEKGLPCKGTVRLRRAAGAVYDLVNHRRVEAHVVDGETEIPVSYKTNDGRIFLAVSRPLGSLTIRAEGDTLSVTSPDVDVLVPIEIVRKGKKPYYAVVRDGAFSRKLDGLDDFSVRDLATGDTYFFRGSSLYCRGSSLYCGSDKGASPSK